jgi:hypothetical protein
MAFTAFTMITVIMALTKWANTRIDLPATEN